MLRFERVKGIFRGEILLALLLLFSAILMSIVSMLPAYYMYMESDEFCLKFPFNCTLHPPEEATGQLHIVRSNLSLMSHNGECLLHLYNMSKSNLTLLEQVHLGNNTERTVDLQSQTPLLFLNVTYAFPSFPPPSLSYKYRILGYNYPYLLLALPATFIGLAGAATALIGSFKLIAERTSHKSPKKRSWQFKETSNLIS